MRGGKDWPILAKKEAQQRINSGLYSWSEKVSLQLRGETNGGGGGGGGGRGEGEGEGGGREKGESLKKYTSYFTGKRTREKHPEWK